MIKYVSVLGVAAALSLGTLVGSAPVSAHTTTTIHRTRTVTMSGMRGNRSMHLRMARDEERLAARARRRGNLRTARRHEAMAREHRRMARM